MCEQKSHISARECGSAGELPQSRRAPVPGSQLGKECHKQLGWKRSEPQEREQEAKMLQCTTAVRGWLSSSQSRQSLKWKWGGDFPATVPSSYSRHCSKTTGEQQHAARAFVSPLFSSSQSPPLIVTQKVSYRNGTRIENYFYLHILTLISRSLCVWRLQPVYSKQSKLAALYTSLILLGLETKHCLWCHAKGSRARNS